MRPIDRETASVGSSLSVEGLRSTGGFSMAHGASMETHYSSTILSGLVLFLSCFRRSGYCHFWSRYRVSSRVAICTHDRPSRGSVKSSGLRLIGRCQAYGKTSTHLAPPAQPRVLPAVSRRLSENRERGSFLPGGVCRTEKGLPGFHKAESLASADFGISSAIFAKIGFCAVEGFGSVSKVPATRWIHPTPSTRH